MCVRLWRFCKPGSGRAFARRVAGTPPQWPHQRPATARCCYEDGLPAARCPCGVPCAWCSSVCVGQARCRHQPRHTRCRRPPLLAESPCLDENPASCKRKKRLSISRASEELAREPLTCAYMETDRPSQSTLCATITSPIGPEGFLETSTSASGCRVPFYLVFHR